MKSPDKKQANATLLRSQAEADLDRHPLAAAAVRPTDGLRHELEVHQIELEMQNQALRETQTALGESRDAYADLYELAPVGYLTLSDQGLILGINMTGAALLGVERQQLLKCRFARFVRPQDAGQWHMHFKEVLGQEERRDCELALLVGNGSRLDVQLYSQRLIKDGQTHAVRMVMTDITERKHAQEALREQEEFFRLLAENVYDFIAVLDLDGRRLYSSPSYRRFVGAAMDLPGTDSFADVHPEDRERVKRVFVETVKTGIGQQIDYRFMHANGDIRDMESRGSVIRNAEGRVTRVVVVSHDVTEKKQVEQQLRIAAAAFESQEGIVVTDVNSVVLRINRAFSEITGYTAEEAVGKYMNFLMSDRHDAQFFATMWETIVRDGAWRGDIWNRIKNGEVHPHRITINAVKDSAGIVTHYVGVYSDITERKVLEEQVHQMAFHDPLTKLPNRRLLSDRLNQAMASSKRSGYYSALVFLDLDNFKSLNDLHGHDVGDMLLVEAAERLKGCVREMDTVARFGGDEFVVMLSELVADKAESISQAGIVAEKIRITLSNTYLLTVKHEGRADMAVQHRCTASIGIALFIGNEAGEDDILKWADTAMYQAKEAGRNSIHFYDPKA